jgi:hypothetical protein
MSDAIEEFFASLSKRPFHRVITPELLDELPDSELEVTIYDIVWAAKKASLDELLRFLGSMSEGYQATYCTMTLEGEVSNGGFNQFFYNDTRNLFESALAGYRRFGLDEIACLVESAAAQYLREATCDEKARLLGTGQLEDFFKSYELSSLSGLDERMWASAPVISASRVAYIRRNAQEFLGDFRRLYE